jgi:hypothetical protein
MENSISMRHNFPQVAAQLDRLALDIGNKAMVRALNTTINQGKLEMSRAISEEYRINVSTAKGRLVVRRATARGQLRFEAVLEASRRGQGRSMNLIAFVTGQLTKRTAKKAGRADAVGQLGFQVKRGGGRKVIPGAFVANDGRTVFIRDGKDRLPIKSVNTIDIPQMFNARKINQVVRRVMLARFPANFQRELRAVLKGYVK